MNSISYFIFDFNNLCDIFLNPSTVVIIAEFYLTYFWAVRHYRIQGSCRAHIVFNINIDAGIQLVRYY
jgi:hypothetical protein